MCSRCIRGESNRLRAWCSIAIAGLGLPVLAQDSTVLTQMMSLEGPWSQFDAIVRPNPIQFEPRQEKAKATSDRDAKQLLFRCIRYDEGINIVGFVRQRSAENSFLTVKIQRTKDGKLRDTVVAPLRDQGKESVDDRVKLMTVIPDEKTVLMQPSVQLGSDAKFRTGLIERNYRITGEKSTKIAGRSAKVILATPKARDLASIRFFLDEINAFPLRKEIIEPDQGPKLDWEVISIEFPRVLDGSLFKTTPAPGMEVIQYSEPLRIRNAKEAQTQLGFLPSLPTKLPFGFAVQSISASEKPEWRALVMKLTDGLQRCTVYQWKPAGREVIKSGEDRTIDMIGGIKVMVVGDLPEPVRDAIISEFQRQALLNYQPGPIPELRPFRQARSAIRS